MRPSPIPPARMGAAGGASRDEARRLPPRGARGSSGGLGRIRRLSRGAVPGLILAGLSFLTPARAAAAPDQRILPLDSGVYRSLSDLYLEQGLALPSMALPYSHEELRRALRRLDYGALSPAGRRAYGSIEKHLAREPSHREEEGLAFYPSFQVNPEIYLHTRRNNDDWIYDAKQRRPFFGFSFDLALSHRLVLYGDLTVQKDFFQAGGDPDNRASLPTSPYQIDLNIPYRAGVSLGGAHWNLMLGRDLLSWGNGRTGNLMLSDADLYHEGLRFTSFYDRFTYTFVLLGLESWTDPASFGPAYVYPPPIDPADLERFKMLIAHRFEFLFRPDLRFAVSETIVYGGKYPDLRVFNPMVIYHNLYLKEWTNNLMTLELDWTPRPGLRVYGQFAMDQLSTVFEQKAYGADSEPNAMGWLGGVEFLRPAGSGSWSASVEAAYTDPWLYIREHPLVSFVSTRRVHSEAKKQVLGDRNYYFANTPLGYSYGPDVVVASARLSYTRPEAWSVYGEHRLLLDGENRITTPFQTGDAAWDRRTPSGDVEVVNMTKLGGWRRFSPGFSVFGEAGMVYNDGGRDLQLALGLRCEF